MEFAVIGLGRFGLSFALELQRSGHDVVGIDKSKAICDKAGEILNNVFILDATDSRALKEVEITRFDKVIVGIGQEAMNASFLTCLNLQECGVKNIIAKAGTFEHKKILNKMGIKDVVMPENDMGKKLAKKLSKQYSFDYFEFGDDVRADKIVVTSQMKCIVDKDIKTINLRKKYQINIIGIQRDGKIIIPEANTKISVDDELLIFGNTQNLEVFENAILKGNHGFFI